MSFERSFLSTAYDGPATGMPVLVLHDRYGFLDDARKLGGLIGTDYRRIAVRAPRAQFIGGAGVVHGFFWYLGPLDKPELSTFGDGLYQLEQLLLIVAESYGGKIGMAGAGEGGVVATVAALIWPDKIARLWLMDAPPPTNLASMPLQLQPLSGLPVDLLAYTDSDKATRTARALEMHGAYVVGGNRPENRRV